MFGHVQADSHEMTHMDSHTLLQSAKVKRFMHFISWMAISALVAFELAVTVFGILQVYIVQHSIWLEATRTAFQKPNVLN